MHPPFGENGTKNRSKFVRFFCIFPSPPPKINFNFNLKSVCIVTKNRQKFYKKNENSFKNLSFILGVNLIDFSNNLKFNEIKF